MEKMITMETPERSISGALDSKHSEQLFEKVKKIEASTRFLEKCLSSFAVLCLIISVSLAIFGVAMRYFFGISYGMVEEICRYTIIYGVFAYIGPLIKINEHIKMDLMDDLLKGKGKISNDLIISILLTIAYAFLFWTGLQWVSSLYQINLMTSSGTMLMAIPTISVPIGMLFGCIFSIQQIILNIYKLRLPNS